MNFFRIVLILTLIAAVLFNSISAVNIILLTIGTLFVFLITYSCPFHKSYSKYIVLFVIWISTIFMPSFHLVEPTILSYPQITQEWNNKILEFGIPVFTTSSILTFVFGRLFSLHVINKRHFNPTIISEKQFVFLISFCIALSVFCYIIGLGRMGAEDVVLPFHLGGAINIFRRNMMPILFAIVIEGYVVSKKHIPRKIFVCYIMWVIVEVFAWLSKSVIVMHLIPAFFLLYAYYKPSFKIIIQTITPLLIIFLFLYPIIGEMRNFEQGNSLWNSFSEARENVNKNDEKNTILSPLNRTFMFGQQYVQDYGFLNTDEIFDFSKFQYLVALGGAARYQTFIIDGYPPTAHHSSGTCGILDPLFHGGIGLLYLVIVVIIILASYADNLYIKGYVSIVVIIISQLLFYTRNANVSTLYDAVGVQTLFVYLLCIYIAYKLNLK